ncbi:MAG: transketolase [Candidatus Pacebacteria bacterium]|nr:transketolase [Candidatus Paceibacterota bacterium]
MNNIENYKKIALETRKTVLRLIYQAQTSHIGSNFSCIDILTVIYGIANIDKDLKEDRDRIVVSKGWVAAALYTFLARKGIISKEDLETYCKEGSKYIGLAEPNVRGVEAAGGSMGFGLPFGVGFALAKKIKKEKGKAFVLMSDGEMDCGTTWESALIAAHNKLDNLIVIVDFNGLQAMGKVKDILNIEPLKDKWQAFGWEVREVDGHNFEEIEKSLTEPASKEGKPRVVIARTTKGKGVSFMEGENIYHYKAPSDEEYQKALKELESNG